MADWAVAFAGHGECDERNIEALLDNWLPESAEKDGAEVAWIGYTRPGRTDTGLKAAAKVLGGLYDPGELAELDSDDDLVHELIACKLDGQDPYLVVVGCDGAGTRQLVAEAWDNDIPVKDLAKALDDVVDEPPPPEPKKPRGRPRKDKQQAPADEAQASDEVAEAAAAAAPDASKAALVRVHGASRALADALAHYADCVAREKA